MKKLFFLILFLAVCYTTYYDISKGTLEDHPAQKKETAKAVTTVSTKQQANKKELPYEKVHITPGDTVLSVVENINPKIPVSIQHVLKDFKILNPGVNPDRIKIGKVYKFPVYK